MEVQYWTFKQLQCATFDKLEFSSSRNEYFFQFIRYLTRKSRPAYSNTKWDAFYDALAKCQFAMFPTPDVQTGVAQVAMNNMVQGETCQAIMHFSRPGCGLHVFGLNQETQNLECLFNKPAFTCETHYLDMSGISLGPKQFDYQVQNGRDLLKAFMPMLTNFGISKVTVLVTGDMTHGDNHQICQRFVDAVFEKSSITPTLQMRNENEMLHLQALRTCGLVFQNLSASDCENKEKPRCIVPQMLCGADEEAIFAFGLICEPIARIMQWGSTDPLHNGDGVGLLFTWNTEKAAIDFFVAQINRIISNNQIPVLPFAANIAAIDGFANIFPTVDNTTDIKPDVLPIHNSLNNPTSTQYPNTDLFYEFPNTDLFHDFTYRPSHKYTGYSF